jgi:regulation of enolase protein 1 (concanavalin A-like superfamily)
MYERLRFLNFLLHISGEIKEENILQNTFYVLMIFLRAVSAFTKESSLKAFSTNIKVSPKQYEKIYDKCNPTASRNL